MKKELIIGTRGSKLAMWQAIHVMELIGKSNKDTHAEIKKIKTKGDRQQDVPFSSMEGTAFFVKEIENALLDEQVDVAVHSGKDLPSLFPVELTLAGFLKRHDPRDVMISGKTKALYRLKKGQVVGTGSARRKAIIRNMYPDLQVKDLRGNVDTRLEKLDSGMYDAIILAAAGVERLGLKNRITQYLEFFDFLPAPAQGAIALQIRKNDTRMKKLLSPLVHKQTTQEVTAERAFLRVMEGGCQVPMGAYARREGETSVILTGLILSPDGKTRIDKSIMGPIKDCTRLGEKLAHIILSEGGKELLGD